MRMRCLITALTIVFFARPATGQGSGQGSLVRIANRTYIAINPLLVPFDIGSAEVESGVAPGVTLGGVASYTEFDDRHWTSFDFKVRYYPSEVVLRGFSVGLTGGFLKYSSPSDSVAGRRESLDAGTIGIVTDYNWMLGPSRRFVVGTGVGVKRILASAEERDRANLGRAYPTARFVIGYAF